MAIASEGPHSGNSGTPIQLDVDLVRAIRLRTSGASVERLAVPDGENPPAPSLPIRINDNISIPWHGRLRLTAPSTKSAETMGRWRRYATLPPGYIAERLQERLRKHGKRLRSGVVNAVSRMKGAPDGHPLPPGELMFLVQGTTNVREFLTDGRGTAEAVVDVLRSSGVEINESTSILDFGCGCGRVIRHVYGMTGARCHGSDYNPRLVDWCTRNLTFAQFGVNGVGPPLPHAAEQFDVVYALSVFTHLPEDLQGAWMAELSRVLKPGGHLLMTTHGDSFLKYMDEEERAKFLAGRLVVRENGPVGSNPFFTAHPPEYVRQTAPPELSVVNFVPERRRRGEPPSRLCWQDGYVLAKRRD